MTYPSAQYEQPRIEELPTAPRLAPPRPLWKRKPAIVGGAALAVLILALIGSMLPQKEEPPIQQVETGSQPFDRAAFDNWWVSGAVPASVRGVVVSVSWNGVALVAETSIHPDADAEAAARGVCSALSGFWLTHGGFRPVQVVGTDGGVLVSRATLADQCSWRRD